LIAKIQLERFYLLFFFSFSAGRDGLKGDKGDGGRHGKTLVGDTSNILNTYIRF